MRAGFQNLQGVDLNRRFEITREIDVMDKVGIDVQGMVEIGHGTQEIKH